MHMTEMPVTEVLVPIAASTDRLVQTVKALDDTEVGGETLVPPWTRGHVITHVARAADSLCLAACSMPSTIVSGSVSNSSGPNSPSSVVLSMGGVMLCPSLVSGDGSVLQVAADAATAPRLLHLPRNP